MLLTVKQVSYLTVSLAAERSKYTVAKGRIRKRKIIGLTVENPLHFTDKLKQTLNFWDLSFIQFGSNYEMGILT